jgi:Ulp1 family protease
LDASLAAEIVTFFEPGRVETEDVSATSNIIMKIRSFKTLRPLTLLNDEAINFVMALLQDHALRKESQGCRAQKFFSSFSMNQLVGNFRNKSFDGSSNYSNVSGWTNNTNVFDCSDVICAVNVSSDP